MSLSRDPAELSQPQSTPPTTRQPNHIKPPSDGVVLAVGNKEENDDVYMLDESRRFYNGNGRNEIPPFVQNMSYRPQPSDWQENGVWYRPVTLDMDSLKDLFGAVVTSPSARLCMKPYNDARLFFWAMDLGGLKIIVKATGKAYFAWLGPQKLFSAHKIATSDSKGKIWLLSPGSERRVSGSYYSHEAYATSRQDNDDDDNDDDPDVRDADPRDGDWTPDSRSRNKPLPKPIKTSLRQSSGKQNLQKQIWKPSENGFDNYRRAKKPKITSPNSSSNPSRITPTAAPPPPLPLERRTTSSSSAFKTSSTLRTTVSSNHQLSTEQLSNTTLHVSVSSNDYGAIPIQLRSCPTIESLYKVVSNAWELDENETQGVRMAVTFRWLPNDEPMVLTRKLPSSFDSMLDVISEAPCWKDEVGKKKKCDVRVKMIMR